jgi:large subunit ribosomal protein L21
MAEHHRLTTAGCVQTRKCGLRNQAAAPAIQKKIEKRLKTRRWRKVMYAVIRTGGKQYRVAPGDVLKIEKAAAGEDNTVEFSEVLAVSGEPGTVTQPVGAKVIGTVVSEGRGAKVLVFHYKRKKQYKKLQGHRQSYTEVRINEIQVEGATHTAAK